MWQVVAGAGGGTARLKRASDKDGSIGRRVIPPPFFGREGLEDLVRSFAHAFDDAGQPDTPSSIRQRLHTGPSCNRRGRVRRPGFARACERSLVRPPFAERVILATMRSDFLDAFQQFEGAAERYEEITLDPMQKSRFGEIIEGPAHRCGLRLEPGLSERLIEATTTPFRCSPTRCSSSTKTAVRTGR